MVANVQTALSNSFNIWQVSYFELNHVEVCASDLSAINQHWFILCLSTEQLRFVNLETKYFNFK